MGVPYQLMEQGGVKVDFQLQSRADIEKLTAEGAANKIAYTPAAIELVRNEVEVAEHVVEDQDRNDDPRRHVDAERLHDVARAGV